jgi:hypothetical protein
MPVAALSAIKAVWLCSFFFSSNRPQGRSQPGSPSQPGTRRATGPRRRGMAGKPVGGARDRGQRNRSGYSCNKKIICTFISNFILIKLKICCRAAGSATWAGQPPLSRLQGSSGPASIPVSYCTVHSMKSQSNAFAPRCCAEPKRAWALYFACAIIMQNKSYVIISALLHAFARLSVCLFGCVCVGWGGGGGGGHP